MMLQGQFESEDKYNTVWPEILTGNFILADWQL